MSTNPTMAHVQEVWQLQATEAYQRESEIQTYKGLQLQQQFVEHGHSTFSAQPQLLDEQHFMPVHIPQSQSSCCGHPDGLCKCGDG